MTHAQPDNISPLPMRLTSDLLSRKTDLLKQGLVLAQQLELSQFEVEEASADELPTQVQSQETEAELSPSLRPLNLVPDTFSWADVWLQRGIKKLAKRNYVGAQDNFCRVLQEESRNLTALNGLGIARSFLKDWQGAIDAFQRAIGVDPEQSVLFCNLGTSLCRVGSFDEAIAAFKKAVQLTPDDAPAFYGLGVALLKQEAYHEAISAFQRAIALNEDVAQHYYALSYVHYKLADFPAAIAALGKAKQRAPQYRDRYLAFLKHCLKQ